MYHFSSTLSGFAFILLTELKYTKNPIHWTQQYNFTIMTISILIVFILVTKLFISLLLFTTLSSCSFCWLLILLTPSVSFTNLLTPSFFYSHWSFHPLFGSQFPSAPYSLLSFSYQYLYIDFLLVFFLVSDLTTPSFTPWYIYFGVSTLFLYLFIFFFK